MKKSLIAVAVAAALPAAAIAQTNVQLYGIGDVNMTFQNDDASSTGDSRFLMNDGLQSGSRVGVQGSEDLGGGLSAEFRFEMGFDVDDGDDESKFFGRQARVGLKGGFGRIRLGRQYDTIFYTAVDQDLTGYAFYANQYGFAGSSGRLDNMVEYHNKFGGFELFGMLAPSESADPNEDDFYYGIGGKFKVSSFGVGLGFQSEGEAGGQIFQIGANGNFGPFAVGLNYGQNDGGASNNERTDIGLTAAMKLGASGNLIFTSEFIEQDNANDVSAYGLAYTHGMSKRTNWYAALGITDVDNVDGTPMNVSVGVRHRF